MSIPCGHRQVLSYCARGKEHIIEEMRGSLKLRKLLTYKYLSLVLSVVVVLLVGTLILQPQSNGKSDHDAYPYLATRIFGDNNNDTLINFVSLRKALNDYAKGQSGPLGIYFEYLPSGTSVGIDANRAFFGASLLKLPVAMKAFKLIEDGKLEKNKEITIEAGQIDKGFGTLWQRGVGAKITVLDAIKLSVASSDNTADKILRDLVQPRPVSDVFDYLDIDTSVAVGPGAGVTPRGYSSTLRALYLSAYLSHDYSNELLGIMTESPYSNRIVAGVPKDVKVAHKIGMYERPDNKSEQVHSDCGIVYTPNRPYILCVMTEADVNVADGQMKAISKMVYDYVSTANK